MQTMLIKKFMQRYQQYRSLEHTLKTTKTDELKELEAKLDEQLGTTPGIPITLSPIVFCLLFMALGFSIPQISLWDHLLTLVALPSVTLFAWIIPTLLLFALVGITGLWFTARGYSAGYATVFTLGGITLGLGLIYLASSLIATIDGTPYSSANLVLALAATLLACCSLAIIHSHAFWRMLLFTLHNRLIRQRLRRD